MAIRVLGVHLIESAEPCHLIAIQLDERDVDSLDWELVTQEADGLPESEWQVAYDERPLSEDHRQWAFFFHYLMPEKPLRTPLGELPLPEATVLPAILRKIAAEYLPP